MKHFSFFPASRKLRGYGRRAALLLGLAALATTAQAQVTTLNEHFDAMPPTNWNVQNLSSPVGTRAWFQGSSTITFGAQATTGYAGVDFNSGASTSTLSDWLITPELVVVNGSTLRFWTRTVTNPSFPDRLQVRLSTAGASTNVGASATSTGDFSTLLLDINPTYTTIGYPDSWTQYTVTITGVPTMTTGRVAFRYFVEDGGSRGNNSEYIGVDEVTYQAAAVAWTGAISTDWATAGNWSSAGVPTSTTDALIPAAPANQPVVTGTQTAKNVAVAANARLTLAASSLLTLGSTSGSGSLTLGTGSAFAQGAGSEIYLGGNFTNNGAAFTLDPTSEVGFGDGLNPAVNHVLNGTTGVTFQILTLGEQGQFDNLSLQVPVQVRRKLGVYNSSIATVGTGGSLTLLSDATGTALVENATGGTVAGTVTVQRYIDPSVNAGPGYRHYSAPVSNSTVADLTTTGFTPTVNTIYNTSATPYAETPFPTVFGYDQVRLATTTNNVTPLDKGYFSPAAPATALVVGRGYAVNIGANQLVDFTGTLNDGDLSLTLARNASTTPNATNAGWQLLGNPYPAPLDYSQVVLTDRTNLDAAIYVYSSTGPYVGNYRSYANNMGGNPVLPLGQGFFVRVSTGQTSGGLTFHNSQRLTSPNATPFQRTATDVRPLVQLELRGATGPADALYAYAEAGTTPGFDSQYDAEKLPNPSGLNLSSAAATGQALAIDGRPAFTTATVLPLAVGVPAAGTYTLSAAALRNLPGTLDAFLTDAATGQTVNLRLQPAYAFTLSTAQIATVITGRFTLHFAARTALATAAALTAAQVSLYPNPAHDAFTVTVPAVAGAAQVQATLLNALGQVVRQQSAALPVGGAQLTVPTAGLAAGVYTLRLMAGAATLAKRVVVE